MKIDNVYPYTDLLSFASTNDICSWNEAIELLREDGYIPFYEASHKEIYASGSDDPNEASSSNPLLKQIIDGFCKQEEVDYITIIDG